MATRFFIVSAILWLFGAPVRRTLEKNFDLAAALFLFLLVGGFVALRETSQEVHTQPFTARPAQAVITR